MTQAAEITVRYVAVDGYHATRKYKTVEGARRFAVERVGASPEMGSRYAVSADGVGRIEVDGTTLRELFGQEEANKGIWYALTDHEGFWVGTYDNAQAAYADLDKLTADYGNLWVEAWKGSDERDMEYVGRAARPTTPAPVMKDYAVMREDAVYSAINDGLIGTNRKVVSQHDTEEEAAAAAKALWATLGEDDEHSFTIGKLVVSGHHRYYSSWWNHPVADSTCDEIPF